jgi:hypothetical protein
MAIDRGRLRRHVASFAAFAAVAALLITLGPAYLRRPVGAPHLHEQPRAASLQHCRHARKQERAARRRSGVQAKLCWRVQGRDVDAGSGSGGEFERLPLVATADPASFEGMMFHLDKRRDMSSRTAKSPVYNLAAADLR